MNLYLQRYIDKCNCRYTHIYAYVSIIIGIHLDILGKCRYGHLKAVTYGVWQSGVKEVRRAFKFHLINCYINCININVLVFNKIIFKIKKYF